MRLGYFVVLLVLAAPGSTTAQGLGDAAAREQKKRRDQKPPAPAKVFTDADLAKGEPPKDEGAAAPEGEAKPSDAASQPAPTPTPDPAMDDLERERAERKLQEAEKLDAQGGVVARQARYNLGRGYELQGDSEAALRQFTHTRQMYPESSEGMAANLGEADLLRKKGDIAAAVLGYRRVLEPFTGAGNYRSDVLPLDQVRARILAAVSQFVDDHHYAEALTLAARLRITEFTSLAIDGFGAVATRRGAWERAARLAGAAQRLLDEIGVRLEPLDFAFRERYLDQVRARIGAAALEALAAEGREMGLERAVAYALAAD